MGIESFGSGDRLLRGKTENWGTWKHILFD